jgi:hypothetical protein
MKSSLVRYGGAALPETVVIFASRIFTTAVKSENSEY